MKLKYFIILFSIIIATTIISAEPPFIQETKFAEGYFIKIPQIGTIKQNQDFTFNFHVINISNGYPIDNSSTDCYFHLYKPNGNQELETIVQNSNSPTVANEWEIIVNKNNFTQIGEYSYLVQCNSSSTGLGGIESVGITVTPSGYTNTLGFYFLIIILSIGLIVLGYYTEDAWVVALGSFAMVLLGLYILFFGIDGIKDTVYTWGIGLIVLALGSMFGLKATMEKLEG